jgi:hypothetical protein
MSTLEHALAVIEICYTRIAVIHQIEADLNELVGIIQRQIAVNSWSVPRRPGVDIPNVPEPPTSNEVNIPGPKAANTPGNTDNRRVVAISGGSGMETRVHYANDDDDGDYYTANDPAYRLYSSEDSSDSDFIVSSNSSDSEVWTTKRRRKVATTPQESDSESDVRPPTIDSDDPETPRNHPSTSISQSPEQTRQTPSNTGRSGTKERWTAKQTERLLQMVASGEYTAAEIARRTGKTVKQVHEKKKTENRRGRLLGPRRPNFE